MRSTCLSFVLCVLVGWQFTAAADELRKPTADQKQIEQLIALLGSKDFAEREWATKELDRIGELALPFLRKASADQDPERAVRAKRCIIKIHERLKTLDLVEQLNSSEAEIRLHGAVKASQLGPEAEHLVPELIKALDDPDRKVRMQTIAALGNIGPGAKTAIPRLQSLINDKNDNLEVRCTVVSHAWKIGESARVLVPDLLRLFANAEPQLRGASARALGHFGQERADVIQLLLIGLDDKDERIGGACAVALGEIGKEPERCTKALLAYVQRYRRKPGCVDSLRVGVGALRRFGARAREAIPTLHDIASDVRENSGVRIMAVYALGAIGPEARFALQKLTKVTEVDDEAEFMLKRLKEASEK